MRRINWQREVGERRQMVQMVKGGEAGAREVLRTNAGTQTGENWRGRGGEAERGTRSGDDEAEEQTS